MTNNLRAFRLRKGLNQRELSEACHTPQSIISALERGVLKPWPKVLHRLARALRVPETELFPTEEEGQDGE